MVILIFRLVPSLLVKKRPVPSLYDANILGAECARCRVCKVPSLQGADFAGADFCEVSKCPVFSLRLCNGLDKINKCLGSLKSKQDIKVYLNGRLLIII